MGKILQIASKTINKLSKKTEFILAIRIIEGYEVLYYKSFIGIWCLKI